MGSGNRIHVWSSIIIGAPMITNAASPKIYQALPDGQVNICKDVEKTI